MANQANETSAGPAVSPVQQAVRDLLDRYPDARVSAVSEKGVSVPVPDAVPLGPDHLRAGTEGVKFYVPEDRPAVIAAFEKAQIQGLAVVTGRIAADPSVVAHVTFLDATEPYGVFLTVSYGRGGSQATERMHKILPEAPRLAHIRKSALATIVDVDSATTSILGWSRQEMVGRRSLEFIHPDDQGLAIENWMELISHPAPARMVRLRHRAKNGAWVWFEATQTNQLDSTDDPCVLTEMVDISKEMAAQEALAAREQLLHRLTQAMPLGVFQTDTDGRVVFANDRFYDIVGAPPARSLRDQLALVVDGDREELDAAVDSVFRTGTDRDLEFNLHLPGTVGDRRCQLSLRALTGPDTTVLGAVGCLSDVTESAVLRRELEDRATFDRLTGCHNRPTIMAGVSAVLARRIVTGLGVAVVFVDLDLFKQVNDEHGHAAGDELLSHVGDRLRGQLRGADTLGRLGGDEFLVVCDQVDTAAAAAEIGGRIAALLDHQVQIGDATVRLRASVGVAWSADLSHDADTLVADADAAMYASKRDRQGRSVLATTQVLAAAASHQPVPGRPRLLPAQDSSGENTPVADLAAPM